jgi:hypothetical protein
MLNPGENHWERDQRVRIEQHLAREHKNNSYFTTSSTLLDKLTKDLEPAPGAIELVPFHLLTLLKKSRDNAIFLLTEVLTNF